MPLQGDPDNLLLTLVHRSDRAEQSLRFRVGHISSCPVPPDAASAGTLEEIAMFAVRGWIAIDRKTGTFGVSAWRTVKDAMSPSRLLKEAHVGSCMRC